MKNFFKLKHFSPLFDFTYILLKYKASPRLYWRVLAYYFKFAIFEPFRWIENLLYRKKLAKYRFEKQPIFILGYYRSGTTHLQEILIQDKQFGFMNFYHCYFSSAFNITEKWLKPFCEWVITSLKFKHPAHGIKFSFELPGEEDVALVSSGFRLSTNWGQLFPRSFKHIYGKTAFFKNIAASEKKYFSRELMYLYKRLSLQNNHKQMILKSPPQTGRIQLLLEMFPQAKFIYIHRNPFEVYLSNLKLWKSFDGQNLAIPKSQNTIKENILWSYDKSIQNYEYYKDLIPKGNLVEIRFDDLLTDPIAEIKKIYDGLSINGFEENRQLFQNYIDLKHGSNMAKYNFQCDDFDEVELRWKKWIAHYGYTRPGQEPKKDSSLKASGVPSKFPDTTNDYYLNK